MATINSSYNTSTSSFNISGLVSGLDTDNIISSLVTIASAPLTQMQTKQSTFTSQLAAWKTMEANAISLKSSSDVLAKKDFLSTSNKATSSDTDHVTVTAGDDAVTGSYNVFVKQLAKAEQRVTDDDEMLLTDTFGTGTLSLTVDGTTKQVNIDEENNTLSEMVDAINESGASVKASLLSTDGTHYKMVLTSTVTGEEGEITVSATGDLAEKFSFGTVLQEGQDSEVYIGDAGNHITVSRSSNTVTDAIPGVTLDLEKAQKTDDDYITINVSSDVSDVEDKFTSLINSFNTMQSYFDTQFYYDSVSKTGGTLQGNSALISMQSELDRITFGLSDNDGKYHSLADIGITADADGTLSISDSDLFEDAVTNYAEDVEKLMNDSTTGIATKLSAFAERLTNSETGDITAQEDFNQERIDELTDKMTNFNDYLTRLGDRYRTQFTAMETALAKLQNQYSSISGAISSLVDSASLGSSNS